MSDRFMTRFFARLDVLLDPRDVVESVFEGMSEQDIRLALAEFVNPRNYICVENEVRMNEELKNTMRFSAIWNKIGMYSSSTKFKQCKSLLRKVVDRDTVACNALIRTMTEDIFKNVKNAVAPERQKTRALENDLSRDFAKTKI